MRRKARVVGVIIEFEHDRVSEVWRETTSGRFMTPRGIPDRRIRRPKGVLVALQLRVELFKRCSQALFRLAGLVGRAD